MNVNIFLGCKCENFTAVFCDKHGVLELSSSGVISGECCPIILLDLNFATPLSQYRLDCECHPGHHYTRKLIREVKDVGRSVKITSYAMAEETRYDEEAEFVGALLDECAECTKARLWFTEENRFV